MKKILKVTGVLPDFNSFKVKVSGFAGTVDGSTLYVVEGEDKNIGAYATVFNDQVAVIDATQAQALVGAVPVVTMVCNICGNTYTPAKPTVPSLVAI